MAIRAKHLVVANDERAGHLKSVTVKFPDAVTMNDRRQESSPPNARTEQLTDTAAIKIVSPVQATIPVANSRDVRQVVRGKIILCRIKISLMHQHGTNVLGGQCFTIALQVGQRLTAKRAAAVTKKQDR